MWFFTHLYRELSLKCHGNTFFYIDTSADVIRVHLSRQSIYIFKVTKDDI